ncbi:MAG: hypothetical protein R3B52_02750 [Candidatus Paceibacterota bacterium]
MLAHTLIEQGENTINSQGFNVIQLAKELGKCRNIIKALELQKKKLKTQRRCKK